MSKICAWCGKEFDERHYNQKFCSDDCASQAKAKRTLDYYHQKATNKPKKMRKCIVCGEEFEVKQGGRKVCSDKCRAINDSRRASKHYYAHKEVVIKTCVICGKEFEVTGSHTVCGAECRKIRDEKTAKAFYEKYKPIARQKKKEWKARMKAEEPLVEVEHRVLDGKVLDKAEMTVDEYNKAHGTNYSYGMYVHYVERNLI